MTKPRKPKLIIHAANIHQGGGKVLLTALLNSLPTTCQVLLIVDHRMPLGTIDSNLEVLRIKPRLAARLNAEKRLAREVVPGDQVLCFGNLPPMFQLVAHVTVFLQNRLLIDGSDLSVFPPWVRLRLLIERQWLKLRIGHCNEVLVQTDAMARLFRQRFPNAPEPRILPLVQEQCVLPRLATTRRQLLAPVADFLYIASGEPHKNHLVLLEAWLLLAEGGLRPSLILTVDHLRHAGLVSRITQAKVAHNLNIENVGAIEHEAALALYRRARALIYPSRLESFGIPLLEARQAGLDVLAPECDYVRDLLDPVESFDPDSPVSIARAVRRYLQQPEPRHALVKPDDFMQAILTSTNLFHG